MARKGMVFMLPIARRDENILFITVEHCAEYCKDAFDIDVDLKDIRTLIAVSLLPVFEFDSNEWLFIDDVISLLPALSTMADLKDVEFLGRNLFRNDIPTSIKPSPHTRIDLVIGDKVVHPAFYAAARNLISIAHSFESENLEENTSIPYFTPTRVYTSSSGVGKYIDEQRARAKCVESTNASQFANSAYYMGSKRVLGGFLVEAISSVLPKDGVVVDLMCGSGAGSGAFSKFWKTLASDAQEFCRFLAVVQGGGFSTKKAESLLRRILPVGRDHASELRSQLSTFLDWEDKIFHSDVGTNSLEDYSSFIDTFPTYPDGIPYAGWNPIREVEKRRQNPILHPYCLFTAYFANIYFGLRQCVEIDSLRFAIEQIEDKYERQWALGALVATLSALGTSYAGHFAQPLIKNSKDLNLKNLTEIIEKRAYSIMHEFSVRLLNLAEESEKSPRPIEVVPGPWPEALLALDSLLDDEPVVVYLDAPYKREEYSRYYHVLETVISYLYPACIGSGKIPDKHKGERFQSEFFTKNELLLTRAFVNVITEILKRGWICAWSYSDSGDASIVAVVKEVREIMRFNAKSYVTPFEHKSQGGKRPKKIKEYLILLMPRDF